MFGRVVLTYPEPVEAPPGAPVQRLPGRRIYIVETYRRGPIKITRERTWPAVMASAGAEFDRRFAEQANRERSQEVVRWIDLDRHPEERLEDHSDDFSDALVREVLREFNALYVGYLERRLGSHEDCRDEQLDPMLEGLGYTGGGSSSREGGDEFELPPPGEAALRR